MGNPQGVQATHLGSKAGVDEIKKHHLKIGCRDSCSRSGEASSIKQKTGRFIHSQHEHSLNHQRKAPANEASTARPSLLLPGTKSLKRCALNLQSNSLPPYSRIGQTPQFRRGQRTSSGNNFGFGGLRAEH